MSENKKEDVFEVLDNKKIHDVEDGLAFCADRNYTCNCIVTHNTKDFYFADVEVLKPIDFLMKYAL